MSEEDEELSRLLSSTALIFAGVLLSSGATLVERAVIGRAFSVELYGEFSLGLTVMTLFTSVTLVGVTQGVTRYMSRFDDERDVRGVVWSGALIVFVVSSVVSAVIYLRIETITSLFFEGTDSTALLRLFVLAIPISTVVTIGVSGIRGLENTRYKIYAEDVFHSGSRIVLLLLLIGLGFGIQATGYAYIASALIALVVTFYLYNRLSSLLGPFRFHGRTLLAFGAPLMVSTILSTLLSRTDTLMLAFFRSSSEVGLYMSAYPLSKTLLLFVSCFGYLYFPIISRLDSDSRKEEIRNVYQITTKWSFLLTFPLFAVFVLFSGDVLTMFFGEKFVGGGDALAVLTLGFFVSATLGRNRETLSALGDTRSVMVADFFALALNFVLNLAFIPRFGFIGAAVASAGAYVLRNVVINVILWNSFGITPFTRRTVRTYVLVPAAVLPPIALVSPWISLSLVTLPAALVIGGVVVVVVASLTGCLQSEDLIAIEFVEDTAGVRLPYLRRYIPQQ